MACPPEAPEADRSAEVISDALWTMAGRPTFDWRGGYFVELAARATA